MHGRATPHTPGCRAGALQLPGTQSEEQFPTCSEAETVMQWFSTHPARMLWGCLIVDLLLFSNFYWENQPFVPQPVVLGVHVPPARWVGEQSRLRAAEHVSGGALGGVCCLCGDAPCLRSSSCFRLHA